MQNEINNNLVNNSESNISIEKVNLENANFIQKVYGWMSLGLAITGLTAFYVYSSEPILRFVFSGSSLVFYSLLFLELVIVFCISRWINKMSATTAQISFVVYSIINGITFSVIFLAYELGSIGSIFLITAGMFCVISVYGYFTKTDLTTVVNLCFMGLIGIIIASVVNLFIMNDKASLVISYIAVIIFTGLTAYDTQKIKQFNIIGNEGSEIDKKEAIIGALTLYLDFINLFLNLLRIFGKRR